jgi:hypothetical protein
LGSSDRAPYLLRAIDSLRAQSNVDARAIVVVNGRVADAGLVERVRRIPGTRIVCRTEAHLPHALAAARALVDTPFFAQLDDDDEMSPDALGLRLERINESDRPDAVVTNGVIRGGGADTHSLPDVAAVARDPVRTLVARNWMVPGSALFRTATVTEAVFQAAPKYLEWTYIGLLLASRYRVAFLAAPTFIHYDDHAFSVNRSRACALGRPRAFDAVLALGLPAELERLLRAKRGAAWHMAAQVQSGHGDNGSAWAAHVRSLMAPDGLRYVLYTRHLLWRRAPAAPARAEAVSSGDNGPA